MPSIIVISDKANITSLPFKTGKRSGVFDFLPGKNELDLDIWLSIAREAGDDMQHYSRFLKPLEAVSDSTGKTDLAALSMDELIRLIDNTMDANELSTIYSFENSGKKRKTVLKSIADQIAKINAIETKKATK